MLEAGAIIIGSILILLGLAGSVLPVLPGPPLSFTGLLLLAAVNKFSAPLTPALIMVLAIVTVVVTGLDYVIPLIGVKRYGASKWGIWGSIAGMIIGLFYPPFGILIGAFVGAAVAEWLSNREKGRAVRAGWGAFIGTLSGIFLKLAACGMMTYYFVYAAIRTVGS
jgi:uncharacterized protein YqgC (DUF456 family)